MNNSKPSLEKAAVKGFTLVELMVVVSIIAILAVIGLTVFSNSQRSARNAGRQGDLKAIANAMETHYNTTNAGNCAGGPAGTYCPLIATMFANAAVPTDSQTGSGAAYCITSAVIASPAPANNMVALANGGCNGNGGANYTNYAVVGAGLPIVTTTAWKICATLEPFTAGGAVYCVTNQQQ